LLKNCVEQDDLDDDDEVTREEVDTAMTKMDVDADGYLTRVEFINGMNTETSYLSNEEFENVVTNLINMRKCRNMFGTLRMVNHYRGPNWVDNKKNRNRTGTKNKSSSATKKKVKIVWGNSSTNTNSTNSTNSSTKDISWTDEFFDEQKLQLTMSTYKSDTGAM